MKPIAMTLSLAVLGLAAGLAARAEPGTAADRAFVAKVSQGGMFEIEAGQLAEKKAFAQDVRDFATMEVHDHTLVGDKLKSISSGAAVAVSPALNAEFGGQLAKLKTLSGPAFDRQYMSDMAELHPKDGAAFLKESEEGSPQYRAYAAEAHKIVQRHIGAIQAVPPS